MDDLTQLFAAVSAGETGAADRLLGRVYDELRGLAARKMAHEAPGHTLQPTALVHEAWLRLGGDCPPAWHSRAHFFAAAAEAMRRILVDRARRRLAARRGGGVPCLDAGELEIAAPDVGDDDALLRLHEALDRLATVHPRRAELVKLRYFVGLDFEETAAALGIAVPTAKQWWAYARAWLAVELRGGDPAG